MKMLGSRWFSVSIFSGILGCALLIFPSVANAQWQATAGAQSEDMGRQALAFLPNEFWIHAGDNITWTWKADDIHTVTFLASGQPRPDFTVGCPGFSPSGSSVTPSTCVTSPPMVTGATFNVVFPVAGNFKLVCLVHVDMTATIHVLDPSEPLPHDQAFYNSQAAIERRALLSDTDQGHAHARENSSPNSVTVGIGETVATGGGHQNASVMRFLEPQTFIQVGGTVEWTNHDPMAGHTITFGVEPANPLPPSSNVTMDPDGTLHATISSTSDNINSGDIHSAPQERLGLPPLLGPTRFRVTFTKPGTYPYRCLFHDNLGMKGVIIVLP